MNPRSLHPHQALLLASFAVLVPLSRGQESKALFDAPLLVADEQQRFENVVDLNGDGFADALSVWWDGTTYSALHVATYFNDQHGKLIKTNNSVHIDFVPNLSAFESPWHVATGDLTGNGRPDIVIGVGWRVRVLSTSVDGVIGQQNVLALNIGSGYVDGVCIDDYDGDGVMDVAVLTDSLTLYHVDPATLAFTPFSTLATNTTNAQLHPVEMNGDGAPDLMVTDGTNVLLCPIIGGQLQTPVVIPHQCVSPKPAAGDIDGDGDVDVVVWGMGQYTVLRRTSANTFSPEYGHVGGPARFLYDLDGDGDLDGVCCGGGGGPTGVSNTSASIFRLAFNDGHGNFAPAQEMPGVGSFKLGGAADLDQDGDLDLVAGRCVFYAHGPWKHAAAPTLLPSEPRPGMIVDFDGDADLDIGLGMDGVRRNLGDGQPQLFGAHLPPPPAGQVWSLESYSGDFDGDGDADMLVTSHSTTPQANTLWLLVNDGGGNFSNAGNVLPPGTTMSAINWGPEARYSITADIDGDGDIDVVAGSQYADDTLLWVNDGHAHFTLATQIHPGHIQKVVDLNGDGIPDLVGHYAPYIGSTYEYAATWRGLGNGSFAPAQRFAPDVYLSAHSNPTVATADVFEEGDVDLIMADSIGVLHLLANNLSGGVTSLGPNQFANYEFQGLGILLDNAAVVSVLDLDGDGHGDIVASSPAGAPGSSYVILRRHDNNGWETPFIQVMRAPLTADMDGDGDLDAVGTNVWLNTRISGRTASSCLQTARGVPDHNGLTPTMGGHGPFRVGEHVDLRLTGAPPQKNGVVLVTVGAFAEQPTFPGGATGSLVKSGVSVIHFHTSGNAGMPGTGSWSLPFTVPPYVAGTTRMYTAIMPDPLVPGGRVVSNQFAIHYAP